MRRSVFLIGFVGVVSFSLGGVAFASHDFSDVPDSHPFHEDISWLASTGITEGFPDGTYRPAQPVTRQSMAAFMRRLAGADPDVPRVVDAAELAGRSAADFDNAVTLNGRTPADFDDSVTLNGRTSADYDDAVTLNGRTPADFDDAVTLGGKSAADLTTTTNQGASLSSTSITGVDPASANGLIGYASGVDTLHIMTMVVNTSYDSGLFTCQVDGSSIVGLTDIKIGDAALGYTDRPSLTGQFRTEGDFAVHTVRCFYESAVGSGSVLVDAWRDTRIEQT